MKSLSKYLPWIFSLLLFSCGPTAKLKRAQKLIAKAEAQGAQWHTDTVYRDRDILVKEVRTDTVFKPVQGDTVRIEKDRLKIKYVKLPGDKVYIEAKAEADTIRIKETITVTREIKTGKSGWYYFKWAAGLAVVFFVFGYIVRAMASKQVNVIIGKQKEPPR